MFSFFHLCLIALFFLPFCLLPNFFFFFIICSLCHDLPTDLGSTLVFPHKINQTLGSNICSGKTLGIFLTFLQDWKWFMLPFSFFEQHLWSTLVLFLAGVLFVLSFAWVEIEICIFHSLCWPTATLEEVESVSVSSLGFLFVLQQTATLPK